MTLREQLARLKGIPLQSEPPKTTMRVEVAGTTLYGWCPKTGKGMYASEEDVPRNHRNGSGFRAYKCECGYWHSTSTFRTLNSGDSEI